LKAFETSVGSFVLRRCKSLVELRFRLIGTNSFLVILFPVSLYPVVGVFVSAYFKALSTARYLHKPVIGLSIFILVPSAHCRVL